MSIRQGAKLGHSQAEETGVGKAREMLTEKI